MKKVRSFARPQPCLSQSCICSFVATVLFLCTHSAPANVYPTNIRLNGGTTNVALSGSGSIAISYLLNEPASGGVTIAIASGATAVRTITLTNTEAGTLVGT